MSLFGFMISGYASWSEHTFSGAVDLERRAADLNAASIEATVSLDDALNTREIKRSRQARADGYLRLAIAPVNG
jgi:hypothetical protein